MSLEGLSRRRNIGHQAHHGPPALSCQARHCPFENEQRQIAVTLIVMVIEGELLLAMCGGRGMVDVEDNRRRGLGVARQKLVDKGLREAIEIGAGEAVFEAGERRGTRQILRGIKRAAFYAQLKYRIIAQAVGVITIRIARGDLIDALREEVSKRMVNIGGVALVAYRGSEALREADLPVDASQQEGAKV
jgi:hypothetical protein